MTSTATLRCSSTVFSDDDNGLEGLKINEMTNINQDGRFRKAVERGGRFMKFTANDRSFIRQDKEAPMIHMTIILYVEQNFVGKTASFR
jgi:hypothetical protein